VERGTLFRKTTWHREASIREIAVARAWRSARRVSGDASDEIEVADVPRAALAPASASMA
jgi:hypothetical protein